MYQRQLENISKSFAVQKVENFNKNQVSALDKCVLQKEFSNVIKLFLCRWKIWSSASGLSSAEEDIIGINVLKLFWKLDCEMSIMTYQFCRNMIFLSFFSYFSHSKPFLISGIHSCTVLCVSRAKRFYYRRPRDIYYTMKTKQEPVWRFDISWYAWTKIIVYSLFF